jgi:hypothetical protein
MVTGVTTEALAGEKMIVTAGALDTHVHFICPQLIEEALASGVTTLYGGGTGPNHGTLATTITPAPSQVQMMLQSTDVRPPSPEPPPPPAAASNKGTARAYPHRRRVAFRHASCRTGFPDEFWLLVQGQHVRFPARTP